MLKRLLDCLCAPSAASNFENLEGRLVLSAGDLLSSDGLRDALERSHGAVTIQFAQLPSVIQQGIDTLAGQRGLTPPAADSTEIVFLNNRNGVETFSFDFAGTDTHTILTVDQNGNAVTPPARSTSTWAVLNGTGAGSNAAAASEIGAIASALRLNVPTDSTVVKVTTNASGDSTYSVSLRAAAGRGRSTTITVDQNGNPVGKQDLPFSVLPVAIRTGLNNARPAGAAALDDASIQKVTVATKNGVTSYSTIFTANGARTTVTVNAAGSLPSLPSRSKTTFGVIPVAAKGELLSRALAAGVPNGIPDSQQVSIYDEANGTVLYTVNLKAQKTLLNGRTANVNVYFTVDQNGNPTSLPGHSEHEFLPDSFEVERHHSLDEAIEELSRRGSSGGGSSNSGSSNSGSSNSGSSNSGSSNSGSSGGGSSGSSGRGVEDSSHGSRTSPLLGRHR
ncbi:MAG: hypothetical protein WC718_14150 [Phycisphaerales bacterium]|jgi:hypothetical protein